MSLPCPKCGEAGSYYTFKGRSGARMGVCYRLTCGHLGEISGIEAALPRPKREPRYYTRPVRPLSFDQETLIQDKFGISPAEIGGYSEVDDRFVLGVFGPKGYNLRGHIAYSLSGGVPKALTYNEKPDEPWVHYAIKTGEAAYVICEDWFSAEKVSTAGAVGVAIMGTNLTQEMVTEIVAAAAGPTYIALDRDAFAKTVTYVARYREQFPLGLYAWSLDKDLKYVSTERIKRALDGDSNFVSDAKGAINA